MSRKLQSHTPPHAVETNHPDSAAFNTTYAIASVGIATLKMLETLLPAAASEVEDESRNVIDCFRQLTDELSKMNVTSPGIRDAVEGIIVGMQFQDRNTQISQNVVAILQRYRTMLEEVCSNIQAMREGTLSSANAVALAVDDILSSIRLSEIRTRYLDALGKAQVRSHHHPHDETHTETQDDGDDIELF